MQYTIPERLLKGMGYAFQKLYANDYKTYRKKIGYTTIWLWSRGKTIEIDDWHGCTDNVIEFYKQHRNDDPDKDKLHLHFNPETGFVQFYDEEAYFHVFKTSSWSEWLEKYGNWHNEIYLRKKEFDLVLEEIEKLIV